MSNTAYDITKRLLNALDSNYNVVDMRAISDIISVLENIHITKELLETTRLGKHVNELRRRTEDPVLARRAKLLVKRWRDLVIPDRTGIKAASSAGGVEVPPVPRGISNATAPAVTPRLCSPQGLSFSQKQGSLTPVGVQSLQRRQPLTSPGLQNVSPGLRHLHSPSTKHISPKTISPIVKHTPVSSPGIKTLSPGIKISPGIKNLSPGIKNLSPGVKNLSPGIRVSLPNVRNSSALRNLSPALRILPETIRNITPSKVDQYDSDSQDVIFVDDTDDVPVTIVDNTIGLALGKASKRPRSPVNGGANTLPLPPIDSGRHRRATKPIKKPKKRRNHTKSENRTVDHSLDPPVGSPFLPVSSASTSPALGGGLRNGLSVAVVPPVPHAAPVPLAAPISLLDDLDSRSPAPVPEPKPRSRKNGCKKTVPDMDDYSTFINNKIPTAGRKIKTTKELLQEIQARKSGNIVSPALSSKESVHKEDFLTAYDSKKQNKKATIVSDIIELNDSNSSFKDSEPASPAEVKVEVKQDEVKIDPNEPVKFEPLEVILARLPPIDRSWIGENEDLPSCSCSLVYNTPEVEVKMPSPPPLKRSIFEFEDETPKETTLQIQENLVAVPALPTFEEKLDPDCEAADVYHSRPDDVFDNHIFALHNCHLPDVNGTKNESKKEEEKKVICKMDSWGLRPFYNCTEDLFLDIVPKYRFLDYSTDTCIKNLSRLDFSKYEPAEPSLSSATEWHVNLEREREELQAARDLKTDNYHSPADSPFSEKCEANETNDNNSVKNVHTISECDGVNLDRDTTCSNSNQSDSATNNNDPTFNSKPADDCEEMDCDSFDSDEKSSQSQAKTEPVAVVVPNRRRFTYGDSVMLLPLSLSDLNASAGFVDRPDGEKGDLSCVFRTTGDFKPPVLSYSAASDTTLVEMKDLTDSAVERMRSSETVNWNCDSDEVKKSEIVESGAFESCVRGGSCPQWVSRPAASGFREWHEPVVRTSYNGEPLTVLPYVVID